MSSDQPTSGTSKDLAPYLEPTPFVDSDHPEVVAHAERVVADIPEGDDIARGVALFYDVRDGIRYDPYTFTGNPAALKASALLGAKGAFCVQKAVLLAALARAVGIPARLGFADVRNHLASERLLELMRTDVFAFHGYVELYLGGKWLKATPVFDRGLCERFRVKPLEFDGRHDALFHPYDVDGERHMEYVHDYGTFVDLPVDRMIDAMRRHYPHFFDGSFAE